MPFEEFNKIPFIIYNANKLILPDCLDLFFFTPLLILEKYSFSTYFLKSKENFTSLVKIFSKVF